MGLLAIFRCHFQVLQYPNETRTIHLHEMHWISSLTVCKLTNWCPLLELTGGLYSSKMNRCDVGVLVGKHRKPPADIERKSLIISNAPL